MRPTLLDIEPVEENLNPKYTFEKFVVGSCNQFAHAAAKATLRLRDDVQSALYVRRRRPGQNASDACHRPPHQIAEPHLGSCITSERF
ncbi:MAG: hypothetical protein IPG58_14945 [Acidobacteria bacterium]|nr:hypothetical protein [Acidobacteriota bacterium]